MNFLDFIPANGFEVVGIAIGLLTCVIILFQVIKEYRSKEKSTMSMSYVVGWVLIFVFWTFYGIRFKALAILLTNGTAFLLQIAMLIIILRKTKLHENLNTEK
jgi:uncharacterized protein with PQ loop repeat